MKLCSQIVVAVVLSVAACAADSAPASAIPSAPRMMVAYEVVLQNGFSIRYDHKDVLPATTRLYFNSAPDSGFVDVPTAEIARVQRIEVPVPSPARVKTPPPASVSVGDIVSSAGSRHQIDPDFLNSVIRAESNFNPGAVSRKGAQGLMQLMPTTANKLGVKNAFEPADNVDGGARYLRELLDLYNGDAAKALAAYNAGPHRVQQYGGVPPYRETHSYIAKIIRDYNRTKLAQHPELKAAAKTPTKSQPKTSKSNLAASKTNNTAVQQTATAQAGSGGANAVDVQKSTIQP